LTVLWISGLFIFSMRKAYRMIPILALMIVIFACVLEAKPEPVVERYTPLSDLSQLDDGTYRGSYAIAGSEYSVDITIEAHVIKGITVIKGPARVFTQKCGLCNAMDMIKEVIGTQTLPVDAYSGATRTTAALFRAIETALMREFERQDDGATHTEAWR
jgi:uncharacterized protein with FMN-binding domain